MPSIDMSDVILDPMFATNFIVYRQSGKFVKGRYEVTETDIKVYGTIVPSSSEDIEQVPEADRVTGMITIYSKQKLFITHLEDDGTSGNSDQVLWHGERYKIISCAPWGDFGFYKSIASRMKGA